MYFKSTRTVLCLPQRYQRLSKERKNRVLAIDIDFQNYSIKKSGSGTDAPKLLIAFQQNNVLTISQDYPSKPDIVFIYWKESYICHFLETYCAAVHSCQ